MDGILLAGEYPGSRDRAITHERLANFLAGIRTFVDLTEQTEPLQEYDRVLAELSAARGLTTKHIRICIEDRGVPSDASVMTGILQTIRHEIAAGRPVYVHCWGGIGRTGTVIGCWLVESGMTGPDAIDTISRLRENTPDRFARSPETDEQRRFICEWTAEREPGV
jgi:protein-tyrosine phosphatase